MSISARLDKEAGKAWFLPAPWLENNNIIWFENKSSVRVCPTAAAAACFHEIGILASPKEGFSALHSDAFWVPKVSFQMMLF